MRDNQDREDFFLRFSHGQSSLLELSCIRESSLLDFEIICSNETGAIVRCNSKSASLLIQKLGGSYKIARIFTGSLEETIESIELPYADKFCWTVSAYKCSEDLAQGAKEELHDFLKAKGLGKSKFIDASGEIGGGKEENEEFATKELKASEVLSRIFRRQKAERKGKMGNAPPEGIDFIVHGGISPTGPFFGYTVGLSDIEGYKIRDMGRPYQDPTLTLGPRIARILVNLAFSRENRILLDPFCGLGTILQEALVSGLSVLGIDKDSGNVSRAKANLRWCSEEFSVDSSKIVRLMRQDARRIGEIQFGKVDCVASEPILLPVFKRNPSALESDQALERSTQIYEDSLDRIAGLLSSSNSKIALVTPTIVDSGGRNHVLLLREAAQRAGLKEYRPSSFGHASQYPLRVETAKKKTVLRNFNIYIQS